MTSGLALADHSPPAGSGSAQHSDWCLLIPPHYNTRPTPLNTIPPPILPARHPGNVVIEDLSRIKKCVGSINNISIIGSDVFPPNWPGMIVTNNLHWLGTTLGTIFTGRGV